MCDAPGDGGRKRQHQKPPDIGREARTAEADLDACIAHGNPDDGKLHQARSHDAPGKAISHGQRIIAAPPGHGQDADQDDVEKDRGYCRREITVQRIQHPAHHRGKRHAGEVGEHDDREAHRVLELYRIVGEARRDHGSHDEGHRKFHHDGQEQEHGKEHAEHFFGKATRAVHAVLFDFLGKKRHESGVEGAFGKKSSKGVRETESGIEGVGHRTGAECRRHEHLAGEAENAAHQRSGRDRGELFDQTHLLKNLCCGLRRAAVCLAAIFRAQHT